MTEETKQTMDEFIAEISNPEGREAAFSGGGKAEADESEQTGQSDADESEQTGRLDADEGEQTGRLEKKEDEQQIPSSRLRQANERRRQAETENTQLKNTIAQMNELLTELMGGETSEEQEGKQEKPAFDQNIDLENYRRDMQLAQISARQRIPDFDDAYAYLIHLRAEEIAEDHGLDNEEAFNVAKTQIDTGIYSLYAGDKSAALTIPDRLYKQAKRRGFAGAKKAGGVNLDAIATNMKQTSKPSAVSANVDMESSVDGLLKKFSKMPKVHGRTDYSAVQELINKRRTNV